MNSEEVVSPGQCDRVISYLGGLQIFGFRINERVAVILNMYR